MLFVSESFYPGWEVVDGKARIIEVFGAFKGIVIERAGAGTLTVRFFPFLFRLGLWLSAMTALLITSVLALRRPKGPSLP